MLGLTLRRKIKEISKKEETEETTVVKKEEDITSTFEKQVSRDYIQRKKRSLKKKLKKMESLHLLKKKMKR